MATRLTKIEQQVPAGGLARLQEANRAEAICCGKAARDASRARTEAESRQFRRNLSCALRSVRMCCPNVCPFAAAAAWG
jgi:hypothetical protein